MKKILKTLSALVLALVLCLSMGTAAFADSSVTYKGGADKFVFDSDGGQLTATDLFGNFKNVFPGDVLTETITVKNTLGGNKTVKIYMKAVPHDEAENPLSPAVAAKEDADSMSQFLSILGMTVTNGSKVIFEGKASETDGREDGVLLGSFKNGESTELTVTLKAPLKKMDDSYRNRIGEVDWVFTAEEIDDRPGKPRTGDESDLLLWTGLMAVSALGAAAVLRKKKT